MFSILRVYLVILCKVGQGIGTYISIQTYTELTLLNCSDTQKPKLHRILTPDVFLTKIEKRGNTLQTRYNVHLFGLIPGFWGQLQSRCTGAIPM